MLKLCKRKLVHLMVTFTYFGFWNIIINTSASESLKSGNYVHGVMDLFQPPICSTSRNYCLSFTTIGEHVYLVVLDSRTTFVAWIANRDDPIANFTSNAALTLDSSGVLQIERDSGNPITLYPPSLPTYTAIILMNKTFIATLRESGNFVLQQNHTNGPKSLLWQSFDYPTDVILPGMKLGVHHKARMKWSIVSFSFPDSPSSGPFSLEWEPNVKQLVIKRKGIIYWASGQLRNNTEFENIPQSMFKYSILNNKYEKSITFKARNDQYYAPWKLTNEGVLLDGSGKYIARADKCGGHNNDGGCRKWNVLACRLNETFQFDSINTTIKYVDHFNHSVDPDFNFTISDCKAACWRNCDCVGFSTLFANGTGCYFVYEAFDNIQPGSDIFYMLNIGTNHKHPDTSLNLKGLHSKWKLIIGITVVTSFMLCGCLLCIARKRRQISLKDEKGIITEHTAHHLKTPQGFEDSNGNGTSKEYEHDLRFFGYASIMEATNGFSSKNELGKGGFGPVYKAWELWKENQSLKLLDPALYDLVVHDEVLRCIHIGLLCVEECPIHRPTMLEVLSMLTNANENLPLHKRPAFYFNDEKVITNENQKHPKIDSINAMSSSDFSAR
ncbi:hypothetical protein VNO77_27787 [Canavalia gladiata]|uniref:Bulb-type lectin domain-containing protein n=1 Tax=Canavalia gladiata TaxID=3824 RepID=A0AAN9Q6T6_CANGL